MNLQANTHITNPNTYKQTNKSFHTNYQKYKPAHKQTNTSAHKRKKWPTIKVANTKTNTFTSTLPKKPTHKHIWHTNKQTDPLTNINTVAHNHTNR